MMKPDYSQPRELFAEDENGNTTTQRIGTIVQADPKIAEDPNTSDVKTITLSYTFFRSKADGPARDLGTAAAKEQVQGKALVGASDKARARAAADKSGSYQTPPMQTETAAQQSRQ